MDIKLKELEQKNKHDQENLKRIIETVAPPTADLVLSIYEVQIGDTVMHYLQKKPVKATLVIFQPPKVA